MKRIAILLSVITISSTWGCRTTSQTNSGARSITGEVEGGKRVYAAKAQALSASPDIDVEEFTCDGAVSDSLEKIRTDCKLSGSAKWGAIDSALKAGGYEKEQIRALVFAALTRQEGAPQSFEAGALLEILKVVYKVFHPAKQPTEAELLAGLLGDAQSVPDPKKEERKPSSPDSPVNDSLDFKSEPGSGMSGTYLGKTFSGTQVLCSAAYDLLFHDDKSPFAPTDLCSMSYTFNDVVGSNYRVHVEADYPGTDKNFHHKHDGIWGCADDPSMAACTYQTDILKAQGGMRLFRMVQGRFYASSGESNAWLKQTGYNPPVPTGPVPCSKPMPPFVEGGECCADGYWHANEGTRGTACRGISGGGGGSVNGGFSQGTSCRGARRGTFVYRSGNKAVIDGDMIFNFMLSSDSRGSPLFTVGATHTIVGYIKGNTLYWCSN